MKLKFLLGTILAINLMPSIAIAETSLADKYENLDIVYAEDWRNGDFDMAWSEVVIVDDDFDGQYLAIFDREKKGALGAEAGIITEWSKKQIKVNFYHAVKQIFGGTRMSVGYAEKIALRVGDSVFKLESKDGIYEVTPEMAKAFANAPDEPVKMKMYPSENEGNEYFTAFGEAVFELDIETIDSWKILYGNKEVALQE